MKSASIAAALFGLIGSIGTAFAAPPIQVAQLPQLNIDKLQTSVSGASSGGYMAVQLHIAYSATFKQGAGVIAGGPYNCANGSVLNAIGRCLGRAPMPVAELVAGTRSLAASGAIDATDNLANANVYLFAGSKDSVVNPSTSADLQRYYQGFLPAANVVFKKDIEAEHAIVTDDYGAPCLTKATPFINNCGFDVAGAILQHLYGPLNARNSTPSGNLGGNLGGTLSEFDQSGFVTGHGMAANGWIYVPVSCVQGAKCRIHVALHGCKQNAADVGDVFVRNAGYNRWADSNDIVVLYPQTSQKAVNSCWDWWGYDDANYARKSAPQMSAIVAIVEKIAAGVPKGATKP